MMRKTATLAIVMLFYASLLAQGGNNPRFIIPEEPRIGWYGYYFTIEKVKHKQANIEIEGDLKGVDVDLDTTNKTGAQRPVDVVEMNHKRTDRLRIYALEDLEDGTKFRLLMSKKSNFKLRIMWPNR